MAGQGNTWRRLVGIGLALVLLATSARAEPRSFAAEGADSVFALGARQLAMGGTGTATAKDTYALYYNPANLAQIDRPMVTLGRQLDATLRPFSFIGFALPLGFARDRGWDATLALGRYPRIHAHSTGAFAADEFESIFLRYLLPGLAADYDGVIDSKTLVNRLALGVTPPAWPKLSFGANVDIIDCRTNTCGVDTQTVSSVHARAVGFGLSVAWRPTDRLSFGAILTDVSPGLDITSVVTDAGGSTITHWGTNLPQRFAIEAAWQARDNLLLALGAQSYFGQYGGYDVQIETLHFGAEWRAGGPWVLRGGLWAPLKIQSSQLDLPPLPLAAAPTLGAAWQKGPISADLAIFAHPVNSINKGRPVISEEFSLTWRF